MTLQGLLAERDYVAGLARRLVGRDHQAAEDLEQEVWAAALARPPRDSGAARGWLRAVARSQAVERLRRRGRAQRAEQEAAREEHVESADSAPARREICEQLARALAALVEPYRSVLVLRFIEELPPREVALRLGRPVETVRTQTRRGLIQLRERLDQEHGQRRARRLGALLLARVPRRRSWPLLAPLLAPLVGLAVLGPLVLLAARPDRDVAAARGPLLAQTGEFAGATDGATPLRRAVPAALLDALPPPSPVGRHVDLRLLDGRGQPLSGVQVLVGNLELARDGGRSDAAGGLRVDVRPSDLLGRDGSWLLPEDGVRLTCQADGRAAQQLVVFLPEQGAVELELALDRPAARLVGRVFDAAGNALAGAQVWAGPRAAIGARSALADSSRAMLVREALWTRSDARGEFELSGLPDEAWELRAWAAGHAAQALALEPLDAERVLDLHLAAAPPLAGELRLQGRPAAGARVSWTGADGTRWPAALRSTICDARGRFELARPAGGVLQLEAVLGSARARAELDLDGQAPSWHAELLAGPQLALRVLAPDGSPRPGLYLTLRASADGTPLGAAATDEQGRAHFDTASPGPYDLLLFPARSQGAFPLAIERGLEPLAGEQLVRLAVDPRELGALGVWVPQGRAARLHLRHLDSGVDHAWRGAGADGRLYAEGLPPARWQVSVVFDDGTLRDLGELELAAGERRELGWIE